LAVEVLAAQATRTAVIVFLMSIQRQAVGLARLVQTQALVALVAAVLQAIHPVALAHLVKASLVERAVKVHTIMAVAAVVLLLLVLTVRMQAEVLVVTAALAQAYFQRGHLQQQQALAVPMLAVEAEHLAIRVAVQALQALVALVAAEQAEVKLVVVLERAAQPIQVAVAVERTHLVVLVGRVDQVL
jgi:hypothetical protein